MKAVLAFGLLVCTVASGWCQGQAKGGDVFKIEVSVNQDSLKTEMYSKWGEFFVDTKIKNISDAEQEIEVWTQKGWSWVSDNPDVVPGTEALQNVPAKIALKPGQEYAGAVEMFCDPNKERPLTFRMGFTPQADRPVSGQAGFGSAEANVIWWSNAAALTE